MKRAIAAIAVLGLLSGCSASRPDPKTKITVQEYPVAYRQQPPEPVYSRLAWSHLPQPIRPKARDNAPLLMPVLSFELPKSTLGEAVQALAQTIGYRWSYPPEAARRPIAINMVASVDEILTEIDRQANVEGMLDHDRREVRVVEAGSQVAPVAAALPEAQ